MNPCPKCLGSIHPHFIENIPCLHCNVCEGLWFKKENLSKLLILDQFSFNKTELNDPIYDATKKNFTPKEETCPFCKENPSLTKKNNHNYSLCNSCQGIWLNKGTIQLLRKNFFKKFLWIIIISMFLCIVGGIVIMTRKLPTQDFSNIKKQKKKLFLQKTNPMILAPINVIIPQDKEFMTKKKIKER